MSDHKHFKEFIVSILTKYGYIKPSAITKFTDPESMKLFRQAFTHKSVAGANNYELFEFQGDTVVNLATVEYLRSRFPRIVSVKWLTRLKHNLISKKHLGLLAEKAGFFEHVGYSKEWANDKLLNMDDPHTNTEYMSLLEDTFEAFVGCLVEIVDARTTKGVGYAIAYNIVCSFLDTIPISLKYEDVFDSKSRLKELYDKLDWNFKGSIQVYKDDKSGEHIATVYGYPVRRKKVALKDIDEQVDKETNQQYQEEAQKFMGRKVDDTVAEEMAAHFLRIARQQAVYGTSRDKVRARLMGSVLGKGRAVTKMDAEKMAANDALETLKRKYNIVGVVPYVYEKNVSKGYVSKKKY